MLPGDVILIPLFSYFSSLFKDISMYVKGFTSKTINKVDPYKYFYASMFG